MKVVIIQFPGSNADWDALYAYKHVLGCEARYVFHKETQLGEADLVVIPGGFAYGDYLRPGAIACFSPIVPEIRRFIDQGGHVLGICNGFQWLTEMQLLPGALAQNQHQRFVCRDVKVRVESSGAFTQSLVLGQVLRLPIAHAGGRYVCDAPTLAMLEANGQIALRYVPPNPNGSVAEIAGVYSRDKRILGLMPHPERACDPMLGNKEGLKLLVPAAMKESLARAS